MSDEVPRDFGSFGQVRQYLFRRGTWTDEEFKMLELGIEKFGTSWVKISELVPGRTQRQCRARWLITQRRERIQKQKNTVENSSPAGVNDGNSLDTPDDDEFYVSSDEGEDFKF